MLSRLSSAGRMVLGLTVAAAALIVLPDPTAALAADTAAWSHTWADVPAGTGPTLISGRVTTSGSGSTGATVVLFAEPAHLDAMPDAGFSLAPIARAQAAADGRWQLKLPDGVDLGRYANPSHLVNFEVRSFDGVGSDAYFFSARLSTTANADRQADQSLRSVGPVVDGDGSAELMLAPEQPITLESSRAPMTHAATVAPGGIHNPSPRCRDDNVSDYPSVQTYVGATYSETSGVTTDFTYARSSSSQLGVGVSGSGAYGSFSQSGTVSMSSTVTESFAPVVGAGNRAYYTYFHFKKFREMCAGTTGTSTVWYVQAVSFNGGATAVSTARIGMGYCVAQQKGSRAVIDKNRAYASSVGASVGSYIGINLSSQTGYSSSTEIVASFSVGHPFCGWKGYPGYEPQLVTTHPTVI